MEDPEMTPDLPKKAGFPIGMQKSLFTQALLTTGMRCTPGVMGLNNSTRLPEITGWFDYNADGYIDKSKDAVPLGYSADPQIVNNYTFGQIIRVSV